MKKIILIILVTISFNVNAGTSNSGYYWCISETRYDELLTAIVRKDNNALIYLLSNNQCLELKGGIEGTKLSGWMTYNVRFYLENGQALELWGPAEGFNL